MTRVLMIQLWVCDHDKDNNVKHVSLLILKISFLTLYLGAESKYPQILTSNIIIGKGSHQKKVCK